MFTNIKWVDLFVNENLFNISSFFSETAMGQDINAQGNSDSEYVKAVYE